MRSSVLRMESVTPETPGQAQAAQTTDWASVSGDSLPWSCYVIGRSIGARGLLFNSDETCADADRCLG